MLTQIKLIVYLHVLQKLLIIIQFQIKFLRNVLKNVRVNIFIIKIINVVPIVKIPIL